MNIGFNNRINTETCAHSATIVVNSSGLDRSICESCGHVSVSFNTDITGEVSRSAFAREADERHETMPPRDVRVRQLVSAGT